MRALVARLVTAAGVFACAVAPCVLAPTSASAGTYAYWSYWHETGSGWKYSGCGAYYSQGDCVPADGTIEGWRFTVSSEGSALPPRYSSGFAAACGSTPARDGTKRVAVIVDYGTQSDAPQTSVAAGCARGAPQDNGGAILAKLHSVASSESFVCRIDSYPKTGCGDYVGASSPTPKPVMSSAPPVPPSRSTNTTTTTSPDPASTPAPTPISTRGTAVPSTSPSTADPSDLPNPVANPSESSAPVVFANSPAKRAHSSPIATLVGIAVIAAGAASAVAISRRRRST